LILNFLFRLFPDIAHQRLFERKLAKHQFLFKDVSLSDEPPELGGGSIFSYEYMGIHHNPDNSRRYLARHLLSILPREGIDEYLDSDYSVYRVVRFNRYGVLKRVVSVTVHHRLPFCFFDCHEYSSGLFGLFAKRPLRSVSFVELKENLRLPLV